MAEKFIILVYLDLLDADDEGLRTIRQDDLLLLWVRWVLFTIHSEVFEAIIVLHR